MKEQILHLASELVRIPSRAGIDRVEGIIGFLGNWLEQQNLPVNRLYGPDDSEVGLFVHLRSRKSGPAICLNACLDTAPFGDEELWQHPPASGLVENGRLYGRGAADSKIAVAIFSHLAVAFQRADNLPYGDVFFVFDADEHTGDFNGIKSFLNVSPRKPDAVLIGYPGNDKLIIGSRGFCRAEITVYGTSAHSGSSNTVGFDALLKMAQLIVLFQNSPLPEESDPYFRMGPKVTVTEIRGGEGFSLVPDCCRCKIDFRLTPNVDRSVAEQWIESVVSQVDKAFPGPRKTRIDWKESWPAFHVVPDAPLVKYFLEAAHRVFKHEVVPVVSGPLNIGNYLATMGIQTLSGFGVSYSNIHATDEYIETDTIMPVYDVYSQAVEKLLCAEFPSLIEVS